MRFMLANLRFLKCKAILEDAHMRDPVEAHQILPLLATFAA
jgi:hypothetical protein